MKQERPGLRFQIADANWDPLSEVPIIFPCLVLPGTEHYDQGQWLPQARGWIVVTMRGRVLCQSQMTGRQGKPPPFQGFLSQFKDSVICPEKWELSGGKSSYKAFLEFKLTFDLGYRSMKLELQMWIDLNGVLANCRVAHSVLQDLL